MMPGKDGTHRPGNLLEPHPADSLDKGETSGNCLRVQRLWLDYDRDTVLEGGA